MGIHLDSHKLRGSLARRFAPVFSLAIAAFASVTGATAAGGFGWGDAPSVVRDIAPNQTVVTGSHPNGFARLGDDIYFFATSVADGRQLWKAGADAKSASMAIHLGAEWSGNAPASQFALGHNGKVYFGEAGGALYATDGTVAGTVKLATNVYGGLEALGGQVCFLGLSEWGQKDLWRTDGTLAGTSLIKPRADWLKRGIAGILVFAGLSNTEAIEPWRTDGTAEGTFRLSSANLNADALHPEDAFFGGRILLPMEDESGIEPWATDGTVEGTFRLADANPGPASSWPSSFFETKGAAFFLIQGAGGLELWRSDGAPDGAERVKLLEPTASPSGTGVHFAVGLQDGLLLETWRSTGPASSASQLWVGDGSTTGTQTLEINPSGSSYAWSHATVGGKAIFMAGDGSLLGSRLFVSDGSREGTYPLLGSVSGSPSGLRPTGVVANGLAYLGAYDPGGELELWRSDGTPNGTIPLLKTAWPSGGSFPAFNFIGSTESAALFQVDGRLVVSDGSREGTALLPEGIDWGPPNAAFSAPGRIYFSGYDPEHGGEPWTSDGTAAGTHLIADIARNPPQGGPPAKLTPWHGGLLFAADDGLHGPEPWISDGSASGTLLLADLYPGQPGSDPGSFASFGAKAFFAAASDSLGRELWSTDGSCAGTALFRDLRAGADGSGPGSLTNFGDELLFLASDDSALGNQFWLTDGTTSGTRPGARFVVSISGNDPERPLPVSNLGAYFLNATPLGLSDPRGLWRTPDALSFVPLPVGLPQILRQAPYVVSCGQSGVQLARFDESSYETVVLDSFPQINGLTPLGDWLYFFAEQRVEPRPAFDLWRSDGSVSGAERIAEIPVAPGADFPPMLCPVESLGFIFFSAFDPSTGWELWLSDGTAEGTRLLWDLVPGPESSSPAEVTASGDRLFFAAEHPTMGRELWSAPLGLFGAPRIAFQPQDLLLNPGQGASFAVRASGAPPLSYQWEKSGEMIDGATDPFLLLSPADSANPSTYRCRVTGANGLSVTTRAARLSIADPPLFDAAAFVSHTLPSELPTGATVFIGVTMRNTSGLTWSQEQGYRLMALVDPAEALPGSGRYRIEPQGEVVSPGEVADFVVEVRAPLAPGDYTATLRMANFQGEPFGQEVVLQIHAIPPRNAVSVWAAYE